AAGARHSGERRGERTVAVWRDRAPLLRPPRAEGSVRPAARGGGVAARGLTRAVLLALALWWIGGDVANADTVPLDTYRVRLRETRSLVLAARSAATQPRELELLSQAATRLRATDAILLADGST